MALGGVLCAMMFKRVASTPLWILSCEDFVKRNFGVC